MSRVLITGTGCSGTQYIAKVLRKCGLDIRWEEQGEDGTASWYHWSQRTTGRYDVIFHQMRDLRKACTGVAARWEPYIWKRSARVLKPHFGDVYNRPWGKHSLANAVRHCYYITKLISRAADYAYSVEKISARILQEIAFSIDHSIAIDIARSVLDAVSTSFASKMGYHHGDYLSWSDIREQEHGEELYEIAQEWGYA